RGCLAGGRRVSRVQAVDAVVERTASGDRHQFLVAHDRSEAVIDPRRVTGLTRRRQGESGPERFEQAGHLSGLRPRHRRGAGWTTPRYGLSAAPPYLAP